MFRTHNITTGINRQHHENTTFDNLPFTEQLTHPFLRSINQIISARAHAKTSLRNFNMATQRARLSFQKVGSYICLYYIISNWELEEHPLRQGELFLSFKHLAGTWDTNEIHPEFWLSLWKGLETATPYANTSISFWSPTSWYPNTRGPWANRRNQSLEPRRMFGRWPGLHWHGYHVVAKSCQSHRIFLEFIECRENSTPWNVTGSLSTVFPMIHGERFHSTKRDTRTWKNQAQTTPRCVVIYKHFLWCL